MNWQGLLAQSDSSALLFKMNVNAGEGAAKPNGEELENVVGLTYFRKYSVDSWHNVREVRIRTAKVTVAFNSLNNI